MAEDKLAVLVIGSLGELVKKVTETDFRVLENPKDVSVYMEGLALKKVLDEWPVLDEARVWMLSKTMRMSMMKYKQVEKELEELLKGGDGTIDLELLFFKSRIAELFKRRDEIRFQIAELNKQSGGVGKACAIPPEADIVVVKIGE